MDKYVAYVSTYTFGDRHGIKIYDVDMENGQLSESGQVEISNSSYITIAHNTGILYSITDSGVEGYRILQDGKLALINSAPINGMRGCYLSTDYEDKYLFVAGYHDGKITVLKLEEDGAIGEITEEIFQKGFGNVSDRNYRPHINCVKMTRDNRYLCAANLGMDHVNIYKLNHGAGKLKLVDVLRSEQQSAPRHLKFSKDGKYLYVVHEIKNYVDVYEYEHQNGNPFFTKIQQISTINKYHSSNAAASTINLSYDNNYMISSNAGDNSVMVYKVDHKTGQLEKVFCLPVSGDYPKDVALFPDNRHLVSLNHESDSMTFFTVDMEKKTLVLNGKGIKVEKPNCIIIYKVSN
ncbi:MAG: lactonase family protein [Eubacteriales bacterium]